jgi:hypothetical protein
LSFLAKIEFDPSTTGGFDMGCDTIALPHLAFRVKFFIPQITQCKYDFSKEVKLLSANITFLKKSKKKNIYLDHSSKVSHFRYVLDWH